MHLRSVGWQSPRSSHIGDTGRPAKVADIGYAGVSLPSRGLRGPAPSIAGESTMRALRLFLASSLIAFRSSRRQRPQHPIPPTSPTSTTSRQNQAGASSSCSETTSLFATLFVYDAARNPTWYVGTLYPAGPGLAWSGSIYLTTGSYFGAMPYNPALFTGRIVGTMTWTPTSTIDGMLTYSVDGVGVSKNITRQTLVNENYNGRFGGGIHQDRTGCFSAL